MCLCYVNNQRKCSILSRKHVYIHFFVFFGINFLLALNMHPDISPRGLIRTGNDQYTYIYIYLNMYALLCLK